MSNVKSEIVIGWLKKKKSEGSSIIFSSHNKRWFVLDINNAVLSYSNKPNKKSSKIISLRKLVSVGQPENEQNQLIGKWEYKFTVVTDDRSYELVAESAKDLKQWMEAFNSVLALKNDFCNENEKKKKKKKKKKKSKDETEPDELFIKKGPMETVQLEHPSPSDDLYIEEASFSAYDSNFGGTDRQSETFHHTRKFTRLQSYRFQSMREATDIEKLRVSDPSSEASKNTNNTSYEKNRKIDEISDVAQIESSNLKGEASFEENWDEEENHSGLVEGRTDLSKSSKFKPSSSRSFAPRNFAY